MAKRKPKSEPMFRFNGPKLKELRELAGLTQSELGAMVGKNFVGISRIESGTVQPTLETTFRLAHALKVEIETLVVEKS